jgi:type IV pilus assembly protein PilB
MDIDQRKVRKALVASNYIDENRLDTAAEAAEREGVPLADYMIREDIITRDLLGQALAETKGVKYYDLNSKPASDQLVQLIPEEVARDKAVVTVRHADDSVHVTTADPTQDGLHDTLKDIYPNKDIEVLYSLPDDIRESFSAYRASLDTRFADLIANSDQVAPSILDEIFADAFMFAASDIHFEPHNSDILVRFRVDGVLQEAGRIPKEHYQNILNRIKVLANLRIDEHFVAQDGSFHYEGDSTDSDVRVSIVPTVEGEKAVLRILTSYIGDLSLANIGLSKQDHKLLKEAGHSPFGMILVTGPTGAGKTTTLYSLLQTIDSPKINVTTIEDPVEYKLPGANQIQVDKENDLGFSQGLRSVVRQDPDVILVGEIRDRDTAEISVNAALTGHLLLSTFHANDAATAVPRLLEMDTEPFLLASTLEVIVAQRLVRTICENCRHTVEKSVSELAAATPAVEQFFDTDNVTLYTGAGCEVCNQTGYDGRTAVFEMIDITPKMEDLILTEPATQEVWDLANKQGSHSMFADGMRKVKSGETTLEELKRVTSPEHVQTK